MGNAKMLFAAVASLMLFSNLSALETLEWEEQTSGEGGTFWCVHFVDSLHGWAGGGSGAYVRTTDGGVTWQQGSFSGEMRAVYFTSPERGYAGSNAGLLYTTVDSGKTWASVSGINIDYFGDGTFISDSIGMFTGSYDYDGVVVRTEDAGSTWAMTVVGGSSALMSICFVNETIGYVAGRDDVASTSDGGATWGTATTVPEADYRSYVNKIWFTAPSKGFGSGRYGGLSAYDGSWTLQSVASSEWVEDIHFADSARGAMVGERGEVRYTVDEGASWTIGYPRHQSSLDAPWFRAVHFVDKSHGWMVGDDGIIMKGRFVAPPEITSAAVDSAFEDLAFVYVATATDPDDVPALSFSNLPSWLVISGDTVTGTPLEGHGDTSFTVVASDGESADTVVVTLAVVPVNDPPVITSAQSDTATEDVPFMYVAAAADPDDVPSISFENIPFWLTVSGDTLSGTPGEGVGDDSFSVIVSDGEYADTVVVNLHVVPVNDPPVITSAQSDTATEDVPFMYVAAAADPDDVPVISYKNVPSWLMVSGDTLSSTPGEGVGDDSFSVIVSDGEYADTLVVNLHVVPVNDPPVITSAQSDTATEDIPFMYVAAATDPDDVPSISFENIPFWLTVSGDTLSGTPGEGVGDDSFSVIVSDGEYADTLVANLHVVPVNDPPVITSAQSDTATEDIPFMYVAAATDPDDVPSISFENIPFWLTVSGDTLSGTPGEGVGDDSFSVIVSDGEYADTVVVNLHVVPVNDPPVITSAQSDTATEDVPFMYVAAAADPDDVPSISFENIPSWLTVSGDTASGTPAMGTADTSFTVIASDGELADTVEVQLHIIWISGVSGSGGFVQEYGAGRRVPGFSFDVSGRLLSNGRAAGRQYGIVIYVTDDGDVVKRLRLE